MFLAIFAPVIVPHNPLKMNSGKDYLPPAWVEKSQTGKSGDPDFLFGTDTLGRDVLSRVIYGARVSMIVGFLPTTIILLVGTSVGMLAGFLGGRTDNYLMRLTDVIYAFPDLLFFIICYGGAARLQDWQISERLVPVIYRLCDRQLGGRGAPGARPGALA